MADSHVDGGYRRPRAGLAPAGGKFFGDYYTTECLDYCTTYFGDYCITRGCCN